VERFSESEKAELWDRFEAGESLRSISRVLGRAPSSVRTHIVAAGWRRPVPAGDWCAIRCMCPVKWWKLGSGPSLEGAIV